jgi:hypothetical protein
VEEEYVENGQKDELEGAVREEEEKKKDEEMKMMKKYPNKDEVKRYTR